MPSQDQIVDLLLSASSPVSARMRAIFGLKGLGTSSAISALEKSLQSDASALVRHEVAYVLGQMRASSALPTLSTVLEDECEDVMVRHEAAEAMGAIGDKSAIPLLEKYSHNEDVAREIRETCVLALEKIRWEAGGGAGGSTGVYTSVDPAPPEAGERSVDELRGILCDGEREMFARYRAMFALRNRGGKEATLALCEGMEEEKGSALFRHEVAYVLGQMQREEAVPTLVRFLRDEKEVDMVRHEAAEALGAIGSEEAERELEQFRKDKADVVRESVEVALDISDYVTSGEMHYAETIGVDKAPVLEA